MRVPERLEPLLDQGVIEDVLRPLMSGKEANVFLVIAGGERRVAKVYKESSNRSFKHRSDYTEGRKVRNTRQARAMAKRSRYGRQQAEQAWRTAEVDAIYRLDAAGVRVPRPYDFVDGVLVMELIADANGEPAPRLVDLSFDEDEALDVFQQLLTEVVKMLCAGLVHGDLSDFNVLFGPNGPVIIDFPQAVDAAANRNARRLLIRDVDNLTRFLERFAPSLAKTRYGQEMWAKYEANELTPHTRLTGRYRRSKRKANTNALLEEIEAVERENRRKREALGLPVRPARRPTSTVQPPQPVSKADDPPNKKRRRRRRRKTKPGPPANDLDAFLAIED